MPALIRLASVATIAIAVWLASVVALVLPGRDPGDIALWAAITVAAAAFGLLSLLLASRDRAASRTRPIVAVGAVAAVLALGAVLLGSAMVVSAGGAHPEGYLLPIGAVFAAHGALVLLWLGVRLVTAVDRG